MAAVENVSVEEAWLLRLVRGIKFGKLTVIVQAGEIKMVDANKALKPFETL